MLACGCAWLRSRFAPLTAVAASLLGGVGSGGMPVFVSPEECGGYGGRVPPPFSPSLTMPSPQRLVCLEK